MKKQSNSPLVTLLNDIMRLRHRLPSQMAADIGINHATVSRWFSGKGIPRTKSCVRLAEYSGIPLWKVLAAAGHAPMIAETAPDTWPDFREYASTKYGDVLDNDLITMIEGLIELRRNRKYKGNKR